jgi:hypothetical protein|tara:strand:+ start:471 stop:920 length:450 start_codon:yes stop_codon:yes gene_type:complete
MPQTFADFAEARQARNDIQLKIVEHALTLCDKLKEDYIAYSIRSIKANKHKDSAHWSDWSQNRLTRLEKNECDMEFILDSSGRKYHKIQQRDGAHGSVHCFIDKRTGEVYKAASWKAPAKIVRYNLLSISSREECFSRADWCGNYLYLK